MFGVATNISIFGQPQLMMELTSLSQQQTPTKILLKVEINATVTSFYKTSYKNVFKTSIHTIDIICGTNFTFSSVIFYKEYFTNTYFFQFEPLS